MDVHYIGDITAGGSTLIAAVACEGQRAHGLLFTDAFRDPMTRGRGD